MGVVMTALELGRGHAPKEDRVIKDEDDEGVDLGEFFLDLRHAHAAAGHTMHLRGERCHGIRGLNQWGKDADACYRQRAAGRVPVAR